MSIECDTGGCTHPSCKEGDAPKTRSVKKQLNTLNYIKLPQKWRTWAVEAEELVKDLDPAEIAHYLAVLSCWNEEE